MFCWQQKNVTPILAWLNIIKTVGCHVSRVYFGMHALIHFSLAFDFLNQDVSRVFLNVVVIGFVPVLTAQLTSTLLSPIQMPMQ